MLNLPGASGRATFGLLSVGSRVRFGLPGLVPRFRQLLAIFAVPSKGCVLRSDMTKDFMLRRRLLPQVAAQLRSPFLLYGLFWDPRSVAAVPDRVCLLF